MEELVINIVSNAPAVVVLIWLVIRLDARVADLTQTICDFLEDR